MMRVNVARKWGDLGISAIENEGIRVAGHFGSFGVVAGGKNLETGGARDIAEGTHKFGVFDGYNSALAHWCNPLRVPKCAASEAAWVYLATRVPVRKKAPLFGIIRFKCLMSKELDRVERAGVERFICGKICRLRF